MAIKIYYPVSRKLSKAISRVRECLLYNLPSEVELSCNPRRADIQFIDFIGQHYEDPSYLEIFDVPPYPIMRKYIIVNHCPPPPRLLNKDYRWLFHNALAIISYIPPSCEYQCFGNIDWDMLKDRYILTPWGVDHRKFIRMNIPRDIDLVYTGLVAETEAHNEIEKACSELNARCFHAKGDLSDFELVYILNRARYVSAMRHHIGFELIGLEGAFCGSVPLYLDYPIYRLWFNNIGVFINPRNIVEDLKRILKQDPKPIPLEKLEMFKCENISRKVWEKILEFIQ